MLKLFVSYASLWQKGESITGEEDVQSHSEENVIADPVPGLCCLELAALAMGGWGFDRAEQASVVADNFIATVRDKEPDKILGRRLVKQGGNMAAAIEARLRAKSAKELCTRCMEAAEWMLALLWSTWSQQLRGGFAPSSILCRHQCYYRSAEPAASSMTHSLRAKLVFVAEPKELRSARYVSTVHALAIRLLLYRQDS
jgi:hypothetical protein